MKSKVTFLVVFGLLFVFLMGCGGSYGGGGGTTYQTIVGTWIKDTITTPPTGDGANLPDKFIFDVNGYGSSSGGIYAANLFYWTYFGNALTFYHSTQIGQKDTTSFLVLIAPQVGTVTSPLTLTTLTGGTATYNR
jgi:hypothetical protein